MMMRRIVLESSTTRKRMAAPDKGGLARVIDRSGIGLNAVMSSDAEPSPEWLEAANLHATVARQLSTLIHQMNNALQTISGHAELLASDPGVGEQTIRRASVISAVADRSA